MGVFKPIKPLYGILFKMNSRNFHHRSIRGSVEQKITLRARDPTNRVSFFLSREVHPHAWINAVIKRLSSSERKKRKPKGAGLGTANLDPRGLCGKAERGGEEAKEAHGGADHHHILLHRRQAALDLAGGEECLEATTGVCFRGPHWSSLEDDSELPTSRFSMRALLKLRPSTV
ncbi:hypothetical protein BHE74_00023768 [Ensete ventricosum]|nr:hypothetical protein BHE74_00023768 [Ensete ventricosum]